MGLSFADAAPQGGAAGHGSVCQLQQLALVKVQQRRCRAGHIEPAPGHSMGAGGLAQLLLAAAREAAPADAAQHRRDSVRGRGRAGRVAARAGAGGEARNLQQSQAGVVLVLVLVPHHALLRAVGR